MDSPLTKAYSTQPLFYQMAVNLKQLEWLRTIPTIGSRLYDFGKSISDHLATVEEQANVNFSGQPPAPPQINAFQMSTGPSGEHQFAITDNGEFSRGNHYFVDYDTNPQFPNPHTLELGQSRNGSVYLPGQTLYARARSAFPTGQSSDFVYHGSPSSPTPVLGGVAGLRAPSQGSGTGAPGAGGGPGPIPTRNAKAGYNWKSQVAIPQGVRVGSFPQVAPMGGGVASGGSGGGSPVIVVPISATILGSDASATLIPAPLSSGDVFIGSAGNLPVAKAVSGDATLAASGALTLETVNTSSGVPGTFGDATHVPQVTINAKGLVTAVASVAITAGLAQTVTSFMPAVMLGSTAVTSYALQSGICIQTGKLVTVLLSISIDALGAGTGNVTIVLPSPVPTCQNTGTGCFGSLSAFLLLTGTPTAEIDATTLTVALFQTGATGSSALTNANLTSGTPGSTFTLSLNYESF